MTHPEVEVAVLGPLEVRGLAHPFHRSAARELAVYLAFHRQGVRNDVWPEALWPTRAVSTATVHSTVSDARRSLGKGADGREHLPRHGRTLHLADTVVTDVECFAHLASASDPAAWREAMALVRGGLFEGLLLTDWATFEGIHAQVVSMVASTALKGAAQSMAEGDGAGAEWTVRRALRISPYDERLYRALVRAADAQGSRAGLRSTMAELRFLAAMGDLVEGSGQAEEGATLMHPRTEALYRELTQDRVPAARGTVVRL
jgi:DNA-binding SARP family transcriptional activator